MSRSCRGSTTTVTSMIENGELEKTGKRYENIVGINTSASVLLVLPELCSRQELNFHHISGLRSGSERL